MFGLFIEVYFLYICYRKFFIYYQLIHSLSVPFLCIYLVLSHWGKEDEEEMVLILQELKI